MTDTLAADDLGPLLLRSRPELFARLRARARWLSARYYGAPVYLVGSAVTRDDWRDIDLCVVLSPELFLAIYDGDKASGETASARLEAWRFGADRPTPPPIWQRWARDVAKQGANISAEFGLNVDFKVQHENAVACLEAMPRVTLCHVNGGVW